MQRRGRSFEVMMKKLYFYGLKRKECVLPDFGSAGGHTEDDSRRQDLGKRERRVMVWLDSPLHPNFLHRISHLLQNKSY